ncbi:asialoglycoprotein receptor 1-like [Dreissena polymorpha]|uniref:C-type lectin domain-containing protein n=1 Tax=Dreissena polymorpha TaxID=45954 RepID=A0A9D4NG38_DREPO|nr:asialoglycoprotein receptor 1-like [Dreissena polymorpha]KAH3893963.1 hypothetical protein DPMN_018118 [Dreissena polymorpha]
MLNLVSLLFLCGSAHLAAGACATGWVQFETSCYKIEARAIKQWTDAKKACEAEKAQLTIIMTKEENDFVQRELRKLQIADMGMQFWMDGTDITTEGQWIWESTGEYFEIYDWSPGEPNQSGGEEDCMSFFRLYDYHWNDEHCNRPEGYVCEKEMASGPAVG